MKIKTLFSVIAAIVVSVPVGMVTAQSSASAAVDVYTTPGLHQVNGREWSTTCENYSSTVVRCRTDIKASQIKIVGGKYQSVKGWVFNNLTYKSSPREQWKNNPLGFTGSWNAADGRLWRTECDTAVTGQGGCRSYTMGTVIEVSGNGYKQVNKWVFNNMVNFSNSSAPVKPPVTTPPTTPPSSNDCAAPKPSGSFAYHPKDENCQVKLMNEARVKAGLQPLVRDAKLDTIARNWSTTMIKKPNFTGFYHNPDFGPQIFTALPNAVGAGENIAYTSASNSGEKAFDMFWNSPGHKANMMSRDFNKVGLGVICDETGYICWTTQNFAADYGR